VEKRVSAAAVGKRNTKPAKSIPTVEKSETFQTLEAALAFIEALRRKKATGYLSVGSWSVRWKEKSGK
jgi:hypothetical protein